jgi:ubiquinol-cytochrome c reductase cytochrome b subunit
MGEGDTATIGERVLEWMKQRLARTFLMAGIFSSPTSANPLSYFGFLAFICFILLGLTGVLLQLYYVPQFAASYDSVARINSEIPYGFEIRNLHYWLANFMIVLSIGHFFYLYFTRKYRLKNEILWVTGIVSGLLPVLAAYTGYVLIMNNRAMLAVDIGSGILGTMNASLSDLLTGFSLTDTIVRMYALHVAIIPVIMIILFGVHFPRKLIVDAPAILATVGAVFVVGGLAPADLGSKFVQSSPEIATPEWYLTGLYALLRTGVQVFTASVLLPLMFILTFVLIGFYDRVQSPGIKERVVHAAIGLTAIAHIALATLWGFRAGDLLHPIITVEDLQIDPLLFFGSLALVAVLIIGATRLLLGQKWQQASLTETQPKLEHGISACLALLLICLVMILQVALYLDAFYLQSLGLRGLPMTEIGLSILGFSAAAYVYHEADAFSKT